MTDLSQTEAKKRLERWQEAVKEVTSKLDALERAFEEGGGSRQFKIETAKAHLDAQKEGAELLGDFTEFFGELGQPDVLVAFRQSKEIEARLSEAGEVVERWTSSLS